MAGMQDSDELRPAVFAFLDDLQREHDPYLTRAQVNPFAFDGQQLSLMVQNGIRTPEPLGGSAVDHLHEPHRGVRRLRRRGPWGGSASVPLSARTVDGCAGPQPFPRQRSE